MPLRLPHSSLDDVLAELQTDVADALTEEPAPPADVVFAAGTGPVVADSSNGHTYRLGTTAGVVTATQVT